MAPPKNQLPFTGERIVEKITYIITDETGLQRETKSLNEATKAFRNGFHVVEHKLLVTYTEESEIRLSIITQLKNL